MKKKGVLALVLVLGLLVGGYLWYAKRPEQKINKVVDHFLDAVEYDTTIFRKRSDVHDAVRETISDPVICSFKGDSRLPDGEFKFESICSRLDLLHRFSTRRDFTEVERSILLIGSKAQVTRMLKIEFAGPGYSGVQTWQLFFDLELGETWMITEIRGEEVKN